MKATHKFPYKWTLKDAHFTKDKGKVFSCFACGGGSTMGYKLAGFDVVGCNEIDPRMMQIYRKNHNPKYSFIAPIQEFKDMADLPEDLYNLDILDGSPPCSTFSTAGLREKAWGKKKKFREGQAEQVLDTLFFDFIDLAKRLQPKVIIAENVKGLLLGDAKKYVQRIYGEIEDAGYYCQHFLLDASRMGVPQRRERVFFVCLRRDLAKPFLIAEGLFFLKPWIDMDFNEPPIPFGEVADYSGREITQGTKQRLLWENHRKGEKDLRAANERIGGGKRAFFGNKLFYGERVAITLTTDSFGFMHHDRPQHLGESEIVKVSSFPQDYDFGTQPPSYVCGMSVPPVMMAQIAARVWEYWLGKM